MIHIKGNATALKQMFKPLEAVAKEIRLNITAEGLTSKAVNPQNTAMLGLELPKHIFMDWEVEPITIGIELLKWNRALQYADKKEIIDINIQMDKSAIGEGLKYGQISFEDADGFQDIIPVVDAEAIRKEPKVPELSRTAFVTIPTARLKKILRKSYLHEQGEGKKYRSAYVTFEAKDGKFITTAEGQTSKCITKTTNDNTGCIVDGTGKALYALDELLEIIKVIKSDVVGLEFANDYPLGIKFAVLNHGVATYLLAPRVESE